MTSNQTPTTSNPDLKLREKPGRMLFDFCCQSKRNEMKENRLLPMLTKVPVPAEEVGLVCMLSIGILIIRIGDAAHSVPKLFLWVDLTEFR